MSGYPPGLSDSDFCIMEGCSYPSADSSNRRERAAFERGEPRSTCIVCGSVNPAIRSHLGWETRRNKAVEVKP